MTRAPHQDGAGRLLETVTAGRSSILTGPGGSGKSYMLQATQVALSAAGKNAPLVAGHVSGSSVPLGVFAGVTNLSATALESPAAVVDVFARRRSESVLLVDDVDHLDDASLYVVTQLISTTRLPVVLTTRDLNTAPQCIQDLYDGGHLVETVRSPLVESEARALVADLVGGELTPRALSEILAAGNGNPLHLREIVRGSLADGRLTQTPHGWELNGSPALTSRLTSLTAERFGRLSVANVEAATLVAMAGECPYDAIGDDDRSALARADVIELTDCGWLRLSHSLDAQHLLSTCPSALRHEIAHRAIAVLRGSSAASRPHATRQADVLALEHGCDFEISSMIALGEYALGSFDAHLALRAATAVLEIDPDALHARRTAGLAASLLGHTETADVHFSVAASLARTDHERTSVALARAQHLGVRQYDATAARRVVHDALGVVTDPTSIAHLQAASLRWAAVAGQTHAAITAPEEAGSLEGVVSLITAGVAGVITGPLHHTTALLPKMREVPAELLALVPGGGSLIDLTESMVLSYSGDVLATRRQLRQAIRSAGVDQPESMGIWEYALGFLEFLSADAEQAYRLGRAAVAHLSWRDSTGLLPAAHALTAAGAIATGRSIEARKELDAVPEAAAQDPKVVMLRTWVDAWQASAERRADQGADMLLDTARWLMTVQHTYFAGMIAHCVARMGRRAAESAALLRFASELAGGGLLRLLASHADAVADQDVATLEHVASDASELGLLTTAADTRLWLSRITDRRIISESAARRHLLAADQMRVRMPTMALWNAGPVRSTLLTDREHDVVRLAADRYSTKEIAQINNVSVNTVTNQLASAFRKLAVGSRAELRDLLRGGGS